MTAIFNLLSKIFKRKNTKTVNTTVDKLDEGYGDLYFLIFK